MFRTTKKFIRCLALSVAVANVHSYEYVVNGESEEAYEIISKYKFPSILDMDRQNEFKKRYPNCDIIETFSTKQSESQFIKRAINAVNQDAQIFAVTKSLYQLIAYTYMSNISIKNFFAKYGKNWIFQYRICIFIYVWVFIQPGMCVLAF